MAQNASAMAYEPSPTDLKILDELHKGRNVPSNIADDIDVTRQYVQQRLQLLEMDGYVRNIGRGVYEVVDDPREDDQEDDN